MTFDFSKPETQELYRLEVAKRVALGIPREQAEMLVAVLMWTPPATHITNAADKGSSR